jgi:uncharacterized protein YjbI with pentapeptide repeats
MASARRAAANSRTIFRTRGKRLHAIRLCLDIDPDSVIAFVTDSRIPKEFAPWCDLSTMPAPNSSTAATLQMIDPASLRHILEQHAMYKANRPGGRLANLSYIDLTEMKLEGVDLSDANLTGARLYGASLRDSIFVRANMFGCDLRNADLRFARLDRADLRGACLRGANLSAASLIGADLREGQIAFKDDKQGLRLMKHEKRPGELDYAILSGADLSGARMNGALAVSTDFSDANLSSAVMSQAKLRKANLNGATINGADLSGADVTGATMRGAVMVDTMTNGCNLKEADTADMLEAPVAVFIDDRPLDQLLTELEQWVKTGGGSGTRHSFAGVDFRLVNVMKGRGLSTLDASEAIFFGMDLSNAELQGANLVNADLRRCNLKGADLRGARLQGAKLNNANLEGANLGPLDLGGGRLIRSDLTGANLCHADISGADLTRARMIAVITDYMRDTGTTYTLTERE